jgi:hypothetical protein
MLGNKNTELMERDVDMAYCPSYLRECSWSNTPLIAY